MNLVNEISKDDDFEPDKGRITVLTVDGVKRYIPSLKEEDAGNFGIIEGKLYYIGTNELAKKAAASQKIQVIPDGTSLDEFTRQMENIAVEAILRNLTGDSFKTIDQGENSSEVGVKLKNKKLDSTDWKLIIEVNNNETVATYGTGWTYIEAGSTVNELGTLKQSYIIDFTNRKKVVFDATKHSMLAAGSNLAVNDSSLILNIDPINMASSDESSWGNAECVNFTPTGDYNDKGELVSGWTGSAIRFDGVDDYIQFYGGGDFSKGFTLTSYAQTTSNSFRPLVKQNTNMSYSFRTEFLRTAIQFNLSKRSCGSDWAVAELGPSENKYDSNNGILCYRFEKQYDLSKGAYLDLVFDASSLQYKIYINGKFIDSTTVNKTYWIADEDETGDWSGFGGIDILQDSTLPYKIGTYFGGSPGRWWYYKYDLFCTRLYNRPLSESELLANYTATTSYHNILVDGGSASTGGETGGDSF